MGRNQIPSTPRDFKHIVLRQYAERQRKARAARRQLCVACVGVLIVIGIALHRAGLV
jgi:Na+/H+ antiporter NhaB